MTKLYIVLVAFLIQVLFGLWLIFRGNHVIFGIAVIISGILATRMVVSRIRYLNRIHNMAVQIPVEDGGIVFD